VIYVSAAGGSEARSSRPLRFGLVNTLADQSKSTSCLLTQLFAALIKQQTGVDAEVAVAGDVFDLSGLLESKKYQMDFFYGVASSLPGRNTYPGLRPLVTVSKYHAWYARLVAAKGSAAADFAAAAVSVSPLFFPLPVYNTQYTAEPRSNKLLMDTDAQSSTTSSAAWRLCVVASP